jgi:UDP-2,4-diacetamido-2,4,6-trideoxy-beta-L-altropyranose hydrolase
MASPPALLIRADASPAIGSGHVMRCLALAEAWQDAGGRAQFASAPPLLLPETLLRKSFQVLEIGSAPGSEEDAQQTLNLAHQHGAEWVVVDGYHFGADFQRMLKSGGVKVLFVDDYAHASPYSADWVLNQNGCAQSNAYEKREAYTQLLLGLKYCLLRGQFIEWQEWNREIAATGHRVLVTMGGSDPANFTQIALRAVSLLADDSIEVDVVIGAANQNSYPGGKSISREKFRLHRDVRSMAKLMASTDVAISAAGTTAWELCFMGLPAILITLAPNQLPIARELSQRQCAIHLGDASDISAEKLAYQLRLLLKSKELRQAFSSNSRELVDGNGARRVVSALRGTKLQLRPVNERDLRMLWEWANDSQVRAASFSSEPIPWATHVAWFAEKMRKGRCHILIAENAQNIPVGQIRFDGREDGDFEIAISLERLRRGQGLAALLIEEAARLASKTGLCSRLHAFVKAGNVASVKAFERSGFELVAIEEVRGMAAVHLSRSLREAPGKRNQFSMTG